LIYLTGVITDGDGGRGMFGGESAGSDLLRKAFRVAARDENIKAVVIRIDSPGGSALASEVMWQAARHVQAKKPLIVSVGSMAASGGYYVASASDRIFADPGAIVGSIGVVGGKFVYGDLMSKLGINTETFARGRNANLFSSTQPFTERQRKMVTSWMKQTYEQFTQRVLTTRKDKIAHIDDVARGRIFSAKQGKDVGLVDEIGGLQQALVYAAGKADLSDGSYDIRVLPPPRTLVDLFSGKDAFDTQSPIRPQMNVVDAIFGLVDPHTRAMLATQLQSLVLFQQHPVQLISPVMIDVR
jgi:protease-4